MLTLDGYGFLGNTSMAYYVRGRAGNSQKLPNSVGVVEMAWIMGLNSAAPLGSNLLRSRVNTYMNVQAALRFNLVIGLNILTVPSFTAQRPNVCPIDPTWSPYH